MAAIATVAPKISKLIPRLASEHDGEVLATVSALRRTLEAAGLDLLDLAKALGTPVPPTVQPRSWAEIAAWCRNHGQTSLSLKEFVFVSDMAHRFSRGSQPTEKQTAWLMAIYAKLWQQVA